MINLHFTSHKIIASPLNVGPLSTPKTNKKKAGGPSIRPQGIIPLKSLSSSLS